MLINKHDSQLGIAEGALAVINIIPGLNIEIYNMKIENFLEYMKIHEKVEVGTDAFAMFHELSQRALKITMELNNKYHTPEEIIGIF